MKYQFVTSMHKPYFDHIGQVMIESWLNCWKGADATLVIYGEGFKHDFNNPQIIWRDWDTHCSSDHAHFTTLTKGSATKFAKKGFAFIHAMENADGDRLCWADADLLFYKKMDYAKFDNLLPNNKLIAFFDQYFNINPNYTEEEYTNTSTRTSYGAESGLVIVNPHHSDYKNYLKNYKQLYLQKDPAITHWYDSEVVVLAARPFLKEVVDLSKLRTTNKTQTPLNRCWITEYCSHQKAKSKLQYSIDQLRSLCGLK